MPHDVESFLKTYPSISMIEALITDFNGIARGKWIPRSKIKSALKTGLKLPKSALALDIWGRDIPELAYENGDIDGYCIAVADSLRPILGENGIHQGQLIMTMVDEHHAPFLGDPRQVLNKLNTAFVEKGLRPCMAVELEFSLLPDPGRENSARDALPDPAKLGGNLYALSELDQHAELLEVLREGFEAQGLPFEGIIKEAAPAQFEVNMAHSDDVMALADQIIRMQRGIRTAASNHGMIASFMPKPMDFEAGNGMHVHCSLLAENGDNIFDNGEVTGSESLHYALGGCIELMPDSMLIFAPSFNAYRRFRAGNHAPTVPTWGLDNRTTALRIPAGPTSATRIEHRVAGADTNPYLALSAVLAGVLHGLENQITPPPPVEGNAWDQVHEQPDLPNSMADAIACFEESEAIATYLSDTFRTIFSKTKRQELDEFERRVTDFELETYLRG